MSDLPAAMQTRGRQPDDVFQPDELLYRRVPPIHWEDWDEDIELDAIELPDMSVVRSKYAHPEWVRFEGTTYKFSNWGVVGFRVDSIPPELQHLGVYRYTFDVRHDPKKQNFPHSEVRAYEDGNHVTLSESLDAHLHLRWREQLSRRLRKLLGPNQNVDVRQEPPPID
ncbi:MAG: hypothetical protein R3E01_13410 [Pirellulaceae bacterium]